MRQGRLCNLWPECSCYTQLARYGKELQDQEKIWDLDDLAIAEMMIYVDLACVASHCPDRRIKEFAKQHLRLPFWNRQKAMGIQ